MERHIPGPGERYVDDNQRPYQVLCIAKCEGTGEKMVIYQMLCGEFECFARPLGMFMENGDRKYQADDSAPEAENKAEKTEKGVPKAVRPEEQANPILLQFLDADTLEQKYQMIKSLRGAITNRLIDDFAVTLDLVIPEGDTDARYQQLLSSVRTMQKFETSRFRPR